MGLIVTSTESKAILIKGTDVTLPSVYVRLETASRADGVTLEINISTYASKLAFNEGGRVLTDVPQGNIKVQILDTEKQSVETAHSYAKIAFEDLGYKATIEL